MRSCIYRNKTDIKQFYVKISVLEEKKNKKIIKYCTHTSHTQKKDRKCAKPGKDCIKMLEITQVWPYMAQKIKKVCQNPNFLLNKKTRQHTRNPKFKTRPDPNFQLFSGFLTRKNPNSIV